MKELWSFHHYVSIWFRCFFFRLRAYCGFLLWIEWERAIKRYLFEQFWEIEIWINLLNDLLSLFESNLVSVIKRILRNGFFCLEISISCIPDMQFMILMQCMWNLWSFSEVLWLQLMRKVFFLKASGNPKTSSILAEIILFRSKLQNDIYL